MRALLIQVTSASLLVGCSAFNPAPPPPQEIIVRVSGDPGEPLKDAALLREGRKVASTDEDGVGKLKLDGKDGESFDIFVQCPEGFQSPATPLQVQLRRFADASRKAEHTVSCPPAARKVVIAIRADGGKDLPVIYLGREIARTDDSGAAHAMLTIKPGESFSLVLDTHDNKRLLPSSPAATFTVEDCDDVRVFDQKFTMEKVKVPGPRGPRIIEIHSSRK